MKELAIAILILNSLFWGLMPHNVHCDVMSKFTSMKCPPHIVHISIGLFCFILAILLAQSDYFNAIYNIGLSLIQTGGRLTESFGTFVKKSSNKFNGVEDFVSTVETYVNKM